jgi:hypothetical protein
MACCLKAVNYGRGRDEEIQAIGKSIDKIEMNFLARFLLLNKADYVLIDIVSIQI